MYLRDLQQSPDGHKAYPSLEYNAYLALTEIPLETYDYRLGNRSALEWIVDRYQVKTDKRTGIVNDPNDFSSDSQYIVKLIGRVVQVSVQTVEIVKNLPVLFLDGE